MNIRQIVESSLPSADIYIYGFSRLAGLLNKKFEGYENGITIGRKLNDKIIDGIGSGPTYEYSLHYHAVNNELAETGNKICFELNKASVDCIFIKPTITDEEYDHVIENNMTYDLSHKMAATRAGLGWIGKTDLFISEKFGPRVRLATILTGESLPYADKTYDESKCGKCNLCVKSCPAKAATGKSWNININRDEYYDPEKCRKKCRELTKQNFGKDISICGICISVCPVGIAPVI